MEITEERIMVENEGEGEDRQMKTNIGELER